VAIVFVLARADNGVIGRGGALPWHLPADLRRFRELTTGQAVVMGRRTFDGLPAPLAGRRNIVLTRDLAWAAAGAEPVHAPGEALALAGGDAVVIGGAEVFTLFRPDRVELTEVHASPAGDTAVPRFAGMREVFRADHPAVDGRPAYSFVRLVRG